MARWGPFIFLTKSLYFIVNKLTYNWKGGCFPIILKGFVSWLGDLLYLKVRLDVIFLLVTNLINFDNKHFSMVACTRENWLVSCTVHWTTNILSNNHKIFPRRFFISIYFLELRFSRRAQSSKFTTLHDLSILLHCTLKLEVVMEFWISTIFFHLVAKYFDC